MSTAQPMGHFYKGAVLFHPVFHVFPAFFFLFNPLKLENQAPLDKKLHSKRCQSNESQDTEDFPWNCLATAIYICSYRLRPQTKLKHCQKRSTRHILYLFWFTLQYEVLVYERSALSA